MRYKAIDHKQYKRKRRLLRDHGVKRSALYRWVEDLAVVKLTTSGNVSFEDLELCGIDFDKTLENARSKNWQEI